MNVKTTQLPKLVLDVLIAAIAIAMMVWAAVGGVTNQSTRTLILIVGFICTIAAGWDLLRRLFAGGERADHAGNPDSTDSGTTPAGFTIRELLLLDENGKPLKSWSLVGKTCLVIGKKDKDTEVDVDLSDSAYAAFVEPQHAVLNFANERWYLEDVSDENGVRVKKAEDGGVYKVHGRPCEVCAGDVLYIANTRLLLT